MANNYFYSNTAVQTALSGSISNVALTITVQATTGFPVSFPYILALDFGGAAEELVKIISAAGTTLTIDPAGRGFGGTSAQSHSLGAVVRHVYNAQDATDFRTHEVATSAIHGVAGTIVGTTDSQTLTNKSLTSPTITGTVAGGASYTSPTITGTVAGGASYTSPSITGTVGGSASYTTPTITSPSITGTVGGSATYQTPTFTPAAANGVPVLIKSVATPSVNQLEIRDSTNALKLSVDNTFRLVGVNDITTGASGAVASLGTNGSLTAAPSATNVVGLTVSNPTSTTANIASFVAGPTTAMQIDSAGVVHAFQGLRVGTTNQFSMNVNGVSTTVTSAFVESTTSIAYSSTSYGTGTTTVSTTIIAPPSGRILVTGQSEMYMNTNSQSLYSTIIATGSTSGTLRAASDATALHSVNFNTGDNNTVPGTISYIITGAVAGETVTLTWQHRVTANAAAIDYRNICAIGLMG